MIPKVIFQVIWSMLVPEKLLEGDKKLTPCCWLRHKNWNKNCVMFPPWNPDYFVSQFNWGWDTMYVPYISPDIALPHPLVTGRVWGLQFLCSRENEDNLIIYSSTGQEKKACCSRIEKRKRSFLFKVWPVELVREVKNWSITEWIRIYQEWIYTCRVKTQTNFLNECQRLKLPGVSGGMLSREIF